LILCAHWASDLDERADQEMDQRMIVAYLVLEWLSARAIHEDFMATPGCNAIACSSVRHYLRGARDFPPSQDSLPVDIRRRADNADRALLSALDERSFASLRQLSQLTHIPTMTVDCRLTESLRFTARHL
jgi:hypothetical protein